jgi:ribonuclease BN (tRNA processing enzyme)
MELTFIGSGNAFGAGGRHNTCFLLAGAKRRLLIDCGASSLVGMRQRGIEPNEIDGVVLTHLHGDHFGGLPFLLLDAQHISKRKDGIFVFGPPGLSARLAQAQEVLFPGSSTTPPLRFPLDLREMPVGEPCRGDGFAVTPYPADHSAGAPCYALRVEMEGKIVAYSGDTAWTEALIEVGRGADLFICECSSYERAVPGHLDYKTLAPRLAEIGAKRVIITHMNTDMLELRHTLAHETADDGLTIKL